MDNAFWKFMEEIKECKEKKTDKKYFLVIGYILGNETQKFVKISKYFICYDEK